MGEQHPFEQFMRKYQNMVFSTAIRLLADEAEAKDISQVVFLKAYERFSMLSESPTVGGWLRTVTTHLCLNHLTRYRNRWRFFSEMFRVHPDGEEREFSASETGVNTVDCAVDTTEKRSVLEAALVKLCPSQRVPLVLFHFERKTYEEIAELTGTSLAKVKTDIHRGRAVLRKDFELRQEFGKGEPSANQDHGSEQARTKIGSAGSTSMNYKPLLI